MVCVRKIHARSNSIRSSLPNLPSRTALANVTNDSSRISDDDCVVWNVASNDRAGSDQRCLSDDHGQQRDATSNRGAALDQGRHQGPFGIDHPTTFVDGPRPQVVGKDDAMTDEDLILDYDPSRNESVRLNLASSTNDRATLNLDEGPYPGILPDTSTVNIDELRTIDTNTPANLS